MIFVVCALHLGAISTAAVVVGKQLFSMTLPIGLIFRFYPRSEIEKYAKETFLIFAKRKQVFQTASDHLD